MINRLLTKLFGHSKPSDAEIVLRARLAREAAFQKEMDNSPFGRGKAVDAASRWEARAPIAGAPGRHPRADVSSEPLSPTRQRRWRKD